jgi:hypothetical protein
MMAMFVIHSIPVKQGQPTRASGLASGRISSEKLGGCDKANALSHHSRFIPTPHRSPLGIIESSQIDCLEASLEAARPRIPRVILARNLDAGGCTSAHSSFQETSRTKKQGTGIWEYPDKV